MGQHQPAHGGERGDSVGSRDGGHRGEGGGGGPGAGSHTGDSIASERSRQGGETCGGLHRGEGGHRHHESRRVTRLPVLTVIMSRYHASVCDRESSHCILFIVLKYSVSLVGPNHIFIY